MYLARTVIGGLMHEHQVILRVVESMRAECDSIEARRQDAAAGGSRLAAPPSTMA